jgi:hypothetical protein
MKLESVNLVTMFTLVNDCQLQRTETKYIYPVSSVVCIYNPEEDKTTRYTQDEVLAAWSLQSGIPVTASTYTPLKKRVSVRRINLHSIFTIIDGHQIQRTETQYIYPATCNFIGPHNGYGRQVLYTQQEILETWSRQTKECYLSVAKCHGAKSRQRKARHLLAAETRHAQSRQTNMFFQAQSLGIAKRLSSFRLRG